MSPFPAFFISVIIVAGGALISWMIADLRRTQKPTVIPEPLLGETKLGNPVFVQTKTGYHIRFENLEPTERFPQKYLFIHPVHVIWASDD